MLEPPLLLNTQQQSGARQDMYIVRKNPPKTPALSERKPKGAVASLVPLRLRRSESAFFRSIYMPCRTPLCCVPKMPKKKAIKPTAFSLTRKSAPYSI